MIKNLLEDFGTENLASDVAALDGVGELFSELSTAYDRFNKANYEYTKASVTRGESATSIKKSLISVMNDKLVSYHIFLQLHLLLATRTLSQSAKLKLQKQTLL